jgi:hypothetical protein
MEVSHMDRCSLSVTRVLGSAIVLAIFAAGCGAGSTFSRPPVDAVGQMGEAHSYAQTTQKLYVANTAGSVSVYSTGSNPTILQTISDGVPKPGGIWVDNRNYLYAVNLPGQSQQTSLPEYKPGETHPFRTIINGIVNCEYVAVDGQRNVDVAGMVNNSFFLEIYPKGQLSPAQTLTIPHPNASRLSGLAFDLTGALLVGESIYLQKGVVYRLAPNSHNFTDLKLQHATGGTIAVDGFGNLYVGSGSSAGEQRVTVYPPNSTKPSRKIAVQNVIEALTVDRDGTMYLETGGNASIKISVFPPGADKPIQSFVVAGGGGGIALSR